MERIIDESELDTCLARVTHILDARSPAEYGDDHMPGAINIPVLSNEQREEVGTLYASKPFDARMLGATYATAAIHEFLKSVLAGSFTKGTSFLIYCARGGQRSGALGAVLSAIGFTVYRLSKGYKTYRARVLQIINAPLPGPIFVLYGYTGSGKTRILKTLSQECNVVDLEGLANHRGSLLGKLPGEAQPNQRAFETELAVTLRGLRPHLPTLIEGESRKIGRIFVPDGIWEQMRNARHLWLELPREQRVRFILNDYSDLQNPEHLAGPLLRLARYLPGSVMQEMDEHMQAREWAPFVRKLLELHYDPLYARPLQGGKRQPLVVETLEQAVAAVRAVVLADPQR